MPENIVNVKVIHMEGSSSRKKSQGRPALTPLEKQRRLVARLFENCSELERLLIEESGHENADSAQAPFLLSTYNQRLAFAREVAFHEQSGDSVNAKKSRQKLNLFRPNGITEETWNSLPEDSKRLAPGKPKMPKELEFARLEVERETEFLKLRKLEDEYGEEPADIDSLRAQHGNTQIGRPGKDILGTLDKELSIAFYKRRDLPPPAEQEAVSESGMGRPRKTYKERFDYFTSIIEHCRSEIEKGESKLNLVDLQLRYLKRLRDRATRLRLQVKTALGPTLITLKKDLATVEDQIQIEVELLSDYQDNFITLTDSQLQSRRTAVEKKIKAFDSLEFTTDH